MIPKIATKGINTTKQILKCTPKTNKIKNVLKKETNTVKNNVEFSKLKRFLEKVINYIKSVFNKIFKKNELVKTKKLNIAKDHPNDPPRIKKLQEIINNPDKYESSDIARAEELLKDAMESFDPETRNLSARASTRIDTFNPTPKNFYGHLDDLDLKNKMEKHLSNEDGIHIRDKFTDWEYKKNLDDMPQIIENANTNIQGIEFKTKDINSIQGHLVDDIQHHADSSLLETIEKNHAQRQNLENHADDLINHNHIDDIDDIDDIPDSFFD